MIQYQKIVMKFNLSKGISAILFSGREQGDTVDVGRSSSSSTGRCSKVDTSPFVCVSFFASISFCTVNLFSQEKMINCAKGNRSFFSGDFSGPQITEQNLAGSHSSCRFYGIHGDGDDWSICQREYNHTFRIALATDSACDSRSSFSHPDDD